MKVRYISSFAVGTLHAMVNKALLGMVCRIFPGQVECYASASAMPHLRGDDAPIHRLHIPAGASRPRMLLRYLASAAANIRLLLTSRPGDLLIYNFNNVMSLRAIDFINRRLRRRIVIFCHGEMEYLTNSGRHTRAYKRLMSRLTCSYFRRADAAPGMRFVVLGDVILRNLRPLLSEAMYERFDSIDHPLIMPAAEPAPRTPGRPLNIGTVGILNSYKGSDRLLQLARRLKDNPAVKLHVVGHMQCDPRPYAEAGVTLPPDPSRPLEPDDFAARVSALDYILLLYPTDTYRLIASGAVLDCLRYGKPLVGLRTEYFQYLFDKFGAFGRLADDIGELESIIATLPAEATPPCEAMRRAAAALSPEALTPRLRRILTR